MAVESTAHPTVSRSEKTFHTGQVLFFAGAHMVHDVFSSFLAPLLPLIRDKMGLSLTLAGSLAMYQRLPSVINPVLGLWSDRLDLRWFIVFAPAVTAGAMSLLGVAPSYVVLALLLLVAGFSAAALHVPGPVVVARVSGDQVGKGMSFWMTAGELARTLGPLFAVGAVSVLTLEGMWPVMLVGVVASAVIFTQVRRIAWTPPSQRRGSVRETWRVLRPVLLPLTAIMVARGFLRGALTSFLPTFFVDEGQSEAFGGAMLSLLEFAGVAGALAAGTLSDRLGRRWVLAAAMLTAPVFMLLFLVADGWLVYPLMALLGVAVFATTPVMMAIVQDHAGGYPATANGLYMGISFVTSALFPTVVGGIADLVGLRTAFAWTAVLALLGVPLIRLLPDDA